MENFELYSLIWYFVVYSFLGWCLEVVFCSVNTGHWVNRGFLNGPVCPIYGFGMVIVLVCLTPLSNNLLLLFAGSFVLTSTLELITGFVLKKAFHTTWWDYTDQPFNIGGYVCLKFSLAWGLGGMAAVRLLHPPIMRLVAWIPHTVGVVLLALLSTVFLIDFIATLTALAGFQSDLRELDKIASMLHQRSDAISQDLGTSAVAADELIASRRGELEVRRDFLRAHLLDRKMLGAARLMKAFPQMQSLRHRETLAELRKDLLNRKSR